MTADAWEPMDFLAEFRERETCLREVTELLKEKAQSETGKLWAHHLPRIVAALGFFQGLLQDEIDHFGEWRYHEFQPEEVLDFIDEDLDKLTQWLSRMTNNSRSILRSEQNSSEASLNQLMDNQEAAWKLFL
jgi:DNA-binding transcriptional MerR regulator